MPDITKTVAKYIWFGRGFSVGQHDQKHAQEKELSLDVYDPPKKYRRIYEIGYEFGYEDD